MILATTLNISELATKINRDDCFYFGRHEGSNFCGLLNVELIY